jgi:hypothetical protein
MAVVRLLCIMNHEWRVLGSQSRVIRAYAAGGHCSAMVCGRKQVSDPEFFFLSYLVVVVVFLLLSGSCKLFQWWGLESQE